MFFLLLFWLVLPPSVLAQYLPAPTKAPKERNEKVPSYDKPGECSLAFLIQCQMHARAKCPSAIRDFSVF